MSLSVPPPTILKAAARSTQPWVNGQGVSTPVTSGTPTLRDDGPSWWVNIARIPGDCDFSELNGIDRLFTPLDDVTLTLDLDELVSVAPLQVVSFAGEMAPACVVDGPTRALNLMLRRGQSVGTMEILALEGPLALPVPVGGTLVVVALDGTTRSGGSRLDPGDAVRQDAGSDTGSLHIEGSGRVAVISVTPRPSPGSRR